MKKAVSYLRVSGKGQVGGDGFPRQRAAVAAYAKRHRLELVQEFRDEGVSGTSDIQNRPGLAALLDYVEASGVSCVLIENASRLSRDLWVQEAALGEFRRHGVAVFDASAENAGDLALDEGEEPTRKLIRRMLGVLHEWEKDMTLQKLRAARERKRRETGRCEGRKPFGSTPAEEAALRRMKELARKPRLYPRKTNAEIARLLNEEGHCSRTGVPWTAAMVWSVMKRHRERQQKQKAPRGPQAPNLRHP